MARLLSLVASAIRGSTGGLTYTANQYHPIVVRARVSPVQPLTNYQQFARMGCSNAETIWKGLTENQKRAWNTFASTVNFVGPLGSYTVPGRTLFFGWKGLDEYLQARGVTFTSRVATAPTYAGRIPEPSILVVGPPGEGTGIRIDGVNLSSQTVHYVGMISRAFNNSRNTFKGPFDASTLVTDLDIPNGSAFQIEFTGLTAGDVHFVRIYCITSGGVINVSLATITRATAGPSSNLLASAPSRKARGAGDSVPAARRAVL